MRTLVEQGGLSKRSCRRRENDRPTWLIAKGHVDVITIECSTAQMYVLFNSYYIMQNDIDRSAS